LRSEQIAQNQQKNWMPMNLIRELLDDQTIDFLPIAKAKENPMLIHSC
jgi:hypothetical protein